MAIEISMGPNAMALPTPTTLKKPPYLITLEKTVGKTQVIERFISLDKPESVNGFVNVKGIFCDRPEDEIIKSFQDILTSTPKELLLELMLPIHKIVLIRSLVFNANKANK